MKTCFNIESWFGNHDGLLVVGGPCSVESRGQLIETAMGLSKIPQVNVLRGGVWKPRTRPSSFEGVGEQGLQWMREAKETTGLPTMTEVATPHHLELAVKYGIDIVWIGARTVVNPFSVQALADAARGLDLPVFIKNPLAPDVKLWLGAVERMEAAGIRHIGAVHRGFTDFAETKYRNAPLWEIPIELHRLRPNIPIITDISHICGRRDILQETAQKAIDLATDGFMIESHCNPETALTDAKQQVTPTALATMLSGLTIRSRQSDTNEQILKELRNQIDKIDDEILSLLSKRMSVSSQIGILKKQNNLTVLQLDRWKNVLESHIKNGKELGLSEGLVSGIFELIHKESINKQL